MRVDPVRGVAIHFESGSDEPPAGCIDLCDSDTGDESEADVRGGGSSSISSSSSSSSSVAASEWLPLSSLRLVAHGPQARATRGH